MGAVRVEEAATVGTELFDGDLGGNRAEGNELLGSAREVGVKSGREALHASLAYEKDREDRRGREEHVKSAPEEVDPEVPDAATLHAGEAAHDAKEDRDSRRCREKILGSKRKCLGGRRQRRLAGVGLPVRIGREADRGIPRAIGRRCRE